MGDIGIEWVYDYTGRPTSGWNNPPNTQANAEGFYNTLNATRKFANGDGNARDRHFEQAGTGAPKGGSDAAVVETVDMVYFAGHGTPNSFEFGVLGGDDARAKPAEIRWGDGHLKWVVINACHVLYHNDVTNPVIDRWGPAFRGLRYILGFGSLASDEPDRGRLFAEHLNDGDLISEAWRKACEATEAELDTVWAYLRADGNGVTTEQDTWIDHADTPNKPNPPGQLYYVHGVC